MLFPLSSAAETVALRLTLPLYIVGARAVCSPELVRVSWLFWIPRVLSPWTSRPNMLRLVSSSAEKPMLTWLAWVQRLVRDSCRLCWSPLRVTSLLSGPMASRRQGAISGATVTSACA